MFMALFLTCFSAAYYYSLPATDQNDSKRTLSLKRREMMENMPHEARSLMEMERKMHVKAYHEAYDTLSEAEKDRYKEIRDAIKENRDAQKEFFESLPKEQQEALATPLAKENVYRTGVPREVANKFAEFEKRRFDLSNQIPDKIKNIELSPEDSELIMKKRSELQARMTGNSYPD